MRREPRPRVREDAIVYGRVAAQRGRIAEQVNGDWHTRIIQVASDHEPIAAVVAFAAADEDATLYAQPEQQLLITSARVLH